jgi:hypothetical protein
MPTMSRNLTSIVAVVQHLLRDRLKALDAAIQPEIGVQFPYERRHALQHAHESALPAGSSALKGCRELLEMVDGENAPRWIHTA